MPTKGIKAILFGIELVLIGAVIMFGTTPLVAGLLGFGGFNGPTNLVPSRLLLMLPFVVGLVFVVLGGIVGFRGYRSED